MLTAAIYSTRLMTVIAFLVTAVSSVTLAVGPTAASLASEERDLIDKAYVYLLPHVAWLTPLGIIITAAGPFIERSLVRVPRQRAALKKCLDELRPHIFIGEMNRANTPEHHYRLTIFKKCLGSRARIWVRSGIATEKSKVCFRFDTRRVERCQGFAGTCLAHNVRMGVEKLPCITGDASDQEIQAYASMAFVTPEWAKKHRPSGRCFAAYPIRRNGRPWGVLVADSRHPEGIQSGWQPATTHKERQSEMIEILMAAVIGAGR